MKNITYTSMRARCLVIALFLVVLCQAQTLVFADNDSTMMTEYNDGKQWAYRIANNFVAGLTCFEEKDDYGKYYQIRVFIQNLSNSATTFCPEYISAYLQRDNDTVKLNVYTNEQFQKKIKHSQTWAAILYGVAAGLNASAASYSSSYSTSFAPSGRVFSTMTQNYNANAAYQANMASTNQMIMLGKMMENDRIVKEQGYLKKTTVYPGEAIVGYMNIKRKKGNVLTINVPINDFTYSFDWDVSKK